MSSEETRGADAFGRSADPSSYVPRLALESALAELSELIGKTPACAALTGEAGLGKTLLLHVLSERLAGAFECVYVPFSRLEPADVWSWVAVAIGLGSGDDDRGAVLGRARTLAADGSGLVLLVDDAATLPTAMRTELIAACETPGLSLVLAFDAEDLAQLGALPAQLRRIDLGPPMTLVETRAYVQARLRHVDSGGTISSRLGARRLAEMHEESGGIPARLHALLDAWLRSSAVEPSPIESGTDEELPTRGDPGAVQGVAGQGPRFDLLRALQVFWAHLQRPRVQLGVAVLFVVLIGGFWFFALKRAGGAASVGVPVERFEVPIREAAPAPPSPAAPTPALPAPPAPAERPAPAAQELGAKAAAASKPVAAKAVRAPERVEARTSRPPAPDPSQPEAPVQLVSARFPEEHVPATLEAAPLAPPAPGPRLSVNAAPWAEIRLDGAPVGETPLGELAIEPGRHVVTAKLPDGRVLERSVEARVGDLYLVFP